MTKCKFAGFSAGFAAVAMIGASAQGAVVVNEVLGSTTGSDTEFIELYNTGPAAVVLDGWTIELWESDFLIPGLVPGSTDGGSPYTIATGTIAPGGFFLLSNALADAAFGVTGDALLPSNAIENSSFTMLLKDDLGNVVNSIFGSDGDPNDQANDGTVVITPDLTYGPDGSFLPGGFYRVGDGSSTVAFLEFSPKPAPSATPGASNIPEPASMALMGLGGLAMLRRRKA